MSIIKHVISIERRWTGAIGRKRNLIRYTITDFTYKISPHPTTFYPSLFVRNDMGAYYLTLQHLHE
jgi:hypothetical protein